MECCARGSSDCAPLVPPLARLLRCATQNPHGDAPYPQHQRRSGHLLGLASSPIGRPEMKPIEGVEQWQLFTEGAGGAQAGARAAVRAGRRRRIDNADAAAAAAAGLSVDSTANLAGGGSGRGGRGRRRRAAEAPAPPRRSRRMRLLSDAAVLLSCIGVAYALQSVLEQARSRPPPPTAPRPALTPPPPCAGGRRRRGGQGL